ncbi:MAG: GNAT family N-acetyltransferase [Granulosicoccus sp.]
MNDAQPSLLTDRLLLRPLHINDALAVQELAGNHEVSKMTLRVPHPYEVQMAREWISDEAIHWKQGTGCAFAICLCTENKLIGAIGLSHIHDLQASFGYWLGEPFWGKGYCSEAAVKVLAFGLDTLKLHKVSAQHLTCNSASGRVLQKAGMTFVRSGMQHGRHGHLESMEFYTISKT